MNELYILADCIPLFSEVYLLETEEERERDVILQDARERGIISNEQFVTSFDEELLAIIKRREIAESLFVSADRVGRTDWREKGGILDQLWVAEYVSKSGNFTIGEIRYMQIEKTIRDNPGITRKEIIRLTGIPKSPVHRYVRKMIEEDHKVEVKKRGLYAIGKWESLPGEWKSHNFTISFLTQQRVTVLEELCAFLRTTDLYIGHEDNRELMIWPTNHGEYTKSIHWSCANDEFTCEEAFKLRQYIWDFFGKKKRLTVRAELNRDRGLEKEKQVFYKTTFTKLGKFWMRRYTHKKGDQREERIEKFFTGSYDDFLTTAKDEKDKDMLIKDLSSAYRTIEALTKEANRHHIRETGRIQES